jgi:hypothetical protein
MTTGAEARLILLPLRGAQAPLFHDAALKGRSSTVTHVSS